jgi:hypothetical protein
LCNIVGTTPGKAGDALQPFLVCHAYFNNLP